MRRLNYYQNIITEFLPLVHQMAQEGTVWLSDIIRLEPDWYQVKLKWASIMCATLDADNFWILAARKAP